MGKVYVLVRVVKNAKHLWAKVKPVNSYITTCLSLLIATLILSEISRNNYLNYFVELANDCELIIPKYCILFPPKLVVLITQCNVKCIFSRSFHPSSGVNTLTRRNFNHFRVQFRVKKSRRSDNGNLSMQFPELAAWGRAWTIFTDPSF